ncbi:MAG: hypothetical protein D6720_11715 [Gammaproteobacteria bacterium]|nr:MAG: hypothetical protein D6720_11715 [Gammaproteobacteria bacterium]
MPQREPIFRVFYQDYHGGMAVSSARPEQLARSRLRPLAESLLVAEDNYLGVIDADEQILQLYAADEPGMIQLELLYPEGGGMLHLTLLRETAFSLLDRLPERFEADLLPGAQYAAG